MRDSKTVPWIVALTKPNHEAIAADNLRRQSYEHYYPKYLFKRPNKSSLIRPLFPRYMFVWIGHTWYSLRGTRGISQVLTGDNGPQTIQDHWVENLKAREDEKGLVQLTQPPKFAAGAAVRTQRGPFAGHLLLYEGQSAHDRCKVLANLLGMKVVVEMDESSLVAA